MSRAYRITIKESSVRQIEGTDEIGTCLEILEILPPEQMAALLKEELRKKGYSEQPDGTMQKSEPGVTTTVDPCSGEVTVRTQVQEEVNIETKREAYGYDDVGPSQREIRDRVKEDLQAEIAQRAEREAQRLQGQATSVLEEKLSDLQPELSEIVNKVTREALKQKAGQLGTVKEISENNESGEMTIKIEV